MVCISVLPWRQSVIISLPSESRVQKVWNSWPFYSLLHPSSFSSFCPSFSCFSSSWIFLTMLRNQEMSNIRRKVGIRINKLLMWNFGCSVEEKINVMMAEERLVWHLTCAHAWKVLKGPSPPPGVAAYCLWLKQHFFNVLLAQKKKKFVRIKAERIRVWCL